MQVGAQTYALLNISAGVVDFALLFVANYGNARGKKYSDPTDLGHAVEMLREVLGQVGEEVWLDSSGSSRGTPTWALTHFISFPPSLGMAACCAPHLTGHMSILGSRVLQHTS